MFKCLSLKTAGHKFHLIAGEHSESITCLPELLKDFVLIKGDAVKLSVISAVPRQSYIVSCQIDVTGCDVMFSCYVIWLLIKDMAQTEHRLDCMAEVTKKEEKNFHGLPESQ